MLESNSNSLISIVTPIYNSEKFLSETIDSVINQKYLNWELFLVDDCSTDSSLNIAKEYEEKDKRISVITLSENSGAAVARNKGINASRGKYLAFLDSDDRWVPSKLMEQVAFMIKYDVAFSFTSYHIVNEYGGHTGKSVKAPSSVSYEDILKHCMIGCLTVMLDIEKLGKVQMRNIRTRQDYVLWLDILKKEKKAYGIDKELSIYRRVEGSISSNKLKAAKQNWHVYRKIEQLPLPKAVFIFANYAWNGIKNR